METVVGKLLNYTLPASYATGIKPISLTRWHIDKLYFRHQTLGTYEAKDLFFDLKIWPLILGKCHLESLIVKDLEIFQDPETSFDPSIFNLLYQNRHAIVSKLHISSLTTSLLPSSVSINFSRKPNLNFLEIYDSKSASHISFEISKLSQFLKFQSEIILDLPYDSSLTLSGFGSIKDKLCLDLKGGISFSGQTEKHKIQLIAEQDKQLSAEAVISSDALNGTISLINNQVVSHIKCHDIESLIPTSDLKGSVDFSIEGPIDSMKAQILSDRFYFQRKALAPLCIEFPQLTKKSLLFKGSFLDNTPNELKLNGSLHLENARMSSEISLHSKPLSAFFKGTFIENQLENLILESKINSLHFFEGFFEKFALSGQGNVFLKYSKTNQTLEVFSNLSKLRLGPFSCDSSLISFAHSPSLGHFKLDLLRLCSPYMEPLSIQVNAEKALNWEGLLLLKNRVLDIKSFCSFYNDENLVRVNIEDIQGTYHDDSITLNSPCEIVKTSKSFNISPLEISCGSTEIQCAFDDKKKQFMMKNFNLECFKLPYFDTGIQGKLSCNIDFQENEPSFLNFSVQDLKIKENSSLFPPLFIHGQCHYFQKKARYNLNAYFANNDFFFAQGNFPVEIDNSLRFHVIDRPSHHFMNFKYDLKDLGRILNMGASSIGGKISGDLNLHLHSQTRSTYGHVKVNELHAGFPFLGIFLDHGELTIRPNGSTAAFEIQINDFEQGKGVAKGVLDLKDYSYRASCKLEKIFVSLKHIFATRVSGITHVEGNFSQITASGPLKLHKSNYELFHPNLKNILSYKIEKIAKDLPHLPKSTFKYDLHFDLNTLESCKIKGVGLDSEWEGHSHCHIANSVFSLKGTLNCKKGEYRFNTKKFNIENGVIHLEDNAPSTILANGSLDIPDYRIKVNLVGPLNSPKLQFSSLPMLSENAIFSYILFNKPISELHPFQSIELAQTLMELSGDQSPVSLSKLRSNLSIDALDIKTSDYDQDKITLHIGKYITPAFLVGLNQSTNTSDVMLQLELKHGFILKAESQEQKEGKLSFKWRKSF